MYFNGLPRVACLTKFQNLKKFVVFGQDLKKMNPGFESCINLTELWICECKLEVNSKEKTGFNLIIKIHIFFVSRVLADLAIALI